MRQKIAIILFAIGVALVIPHVWHRLQWEGHYRTVELVVDAREALALAKFSGVEFRSLLQEYQKRGVTSVAIPEISSARLEKNPHPLLVDDPEEYVRFRRSGFDNQLLTDVKMAGLRPLARPMNDMLLDLPGLKRKVQAIQSIFGKNVIIFDGEEVLGAHGFVPEVAQSLREGGTPYGFVELAEQKGDQKLLSSINPFFIRVHSIPPDELTEMPMEKAVRRMLRAARERSVRILFLHLLENPIERQTLRETNLNYIQQIAERLRHDGFGLGQARPMPRFGPSRISQVGATLGIMGAVGLLPFSEVHWIGILVLLGVLSIMGFKSMAALKLMALMAAVLIPLGIFSLGILFQEPGRRSFSAAVARAVMIALLSMAGGLFINTLLSHTSFLNGTDLFLGVKVAFALPLLLAFAWVMDLYSKKRLRDYLATGVTWGGLFLFVLLGVAGLIYILRTGNFTLPMLPFEEKLRQMLEGSLSVRPRSRELLIGYPALILAELGAPYWGNIFPWLLTAAAMVPISIVNTFCHLHTPLGISILRSLYGLFLGCGIGLFLFILLKWKRPQ